MLIERLVRIARVAGDLMTSNPVSIDHTARVPRAAAFLSERGISAAPVINDGGRPIGVLSQSDLVRHAGSLAESNREGETCPRHAWLSAELLVQDTERSDCQCPTVTEVMTPHVYSVTECAPVVRVVEELLCRNVHRVFVIDRDGVLVGVVTALDVLRGLRR